MIVRDTAELTVTVNGGQESIQVTAALTMEIIETLFGYSMYKIRFTDRDVGTWNEIAKKVDVTGAIRVGAIVDTIEEGVWSNWKQFRVIQMVLKSEGDVMHVTLIGQDAMHELRNRASQHTYFEKTIQQMVEAIAKDHDLKAKIINTSDKYSLRQGLSSDYDFIKHVLLPRCRTVTTDEISMFYINQTGKQELVLTTYAELSKAKAKIKYNYDPQESTEFDPLRRAYLTTFTASSMISTDNYGLKGIGFDPLKGQGIPYTLSTEYSDTITAYPTLGAVKPKGLGGTSKIEPFVLEMLDLDFAKEVDTRLDWTHFFSHRLAIPTQLLHKVTVGAMAQVEATTGLDVPLFCAGKHLIYAVYHRVYPTGQSGTVTFLARRGAVNA